MIDNPWFYLAAVPVILITGASKGGFGSGLGILAVPLLTLTASVNQTTGIMLPILLVMDAFGLWAYRRQWDLSNLGVLVPGSLVGIAIGTATFHWMSEQAIRLVIGMVAIAFTVHHWWGGAVAVPHRAPAWAGVFWGSLSGFTSFVAHAGGPPASFYLLPQRLDKSVFVGTTVIYFAWVNFAKLLPYAWLGQLNAGNLKTALVLSPLAPLGIALGVFLHRRLSPDLFYALCYWFVFGAGVKLLYDGIGLPAIGG